MEKKETSMKKPRVIKASEEVQLALKKVENSPTIEDRRNNLEALKIARTNHRSLTRHHRNGWRKNHDEQFFDILSSKPTSAFSAVRAAKSSSQVQVPYILVRGRKYIGDKVIDGFFDSLQTLKTLDYTELEQNHHHHSLMQDYKYIRYLCSNKCDLPPISLTKSNQILTRIKASVIDFFSITAHHYIYAGQAGLVHFNFLLNVLIADVNNCSINELNTILALLLHKGHEKDKTLDGSYRTISTCPLLAKSLDLYVRDLYIEKWNNCQAPTQYQGEGSSHGLASLLVTEVIQYSKYRSSLPIFLLFLDAKSAFDTVVGPYLVRKLFMTGMEGNSLLYTDIRLSSRITFCQFDKNVVGPIHDEHGVEQGGVSSSDFYKVYNNELLTTAQKSNLGAELGGSQIISAVGQADDTVLVSNDINKLQHILRLVLEYCKKFNVQLSSTKTKLIMIPTVKAKQFIPFNPVCINNEEIFYIDLCKF